MKLLSLSLVVVSTFLASSVNATTESKTDTRLDKVMPVMQQSKFFKGNGVKQKTDFASYQVESNEKGDLVNKGSLVRNTLTGNVAPLSGNITVLLKKGASANDLARQFGLTLVSDYSGTDLAVFKVAANQDLVEATKMLNSSNLVKTARIEVLEVRYKAD